MRRRLAAWALLTAALSLVALPGIAGSASASPIEPIPDAAFRDLAIDLAPDGDEPLVAPLALDGRSASHLAEDAVLVDPGRGTPAAPASLYRRPSGPIPASTGARTWKPPRYTISGRATWYDNGTTAMRLPRGTRVVICGSAGCVERTINDYGPSASFRPARVADLMPADFVAVCGCSLGTGVTWVTVRVY